MPSNHLPFLYRFAILFALADCLNIVFKYSQSTRVLGGDADGAIPRKLSSLEVDTPHRQKEVPECPPESAIT
jgi:hypothetical protein